MNEDLKRIWMTYFKDKTFTPYISSVKINFANYFFNDSPVYNIYYKKQFNKCVRRDNGIWYEVCSYGYINLLCADLKYPTNCVFKLMIKEIEPRLEYFDYFKHKKIFHEFKDKRKLQIIYLTLRKKIPSLSIFLILSFVRVIDLGHIM